MTAPSPLVRIGNGYDIHRLVEGTNLIIGGVELNHPNNLGLEGHSDADVLIHSIMDALLGALSLGDIGKYFPPNDEQWRNANSLILLSKVISLIRDEGWEINNLDNVKEEIIFQRKIGRIRDIQVHPKNGKIYFLSKKSLWIMEKV